MISLMSLLLERDVSGDVGKRRLRDWGAWFWRPGLLWRPNV